MTTQAPVNQEDGLLLPGLDGTNPLGFLAALGLFRAVDDALDRAPIRILWQPGLGTWVPVIVGTDLQPKSLLELLEIALVKQIDQHSIGTLNELSDSSDSSRRKLFQLQTRDACSESRNDTDWLAALACDVVPSSAINQLQTTRRDYHFGNLTSVISNTTSEHLHRTLFATWDYADPLDNQSLHLDPTEDRRHAHQWNKPAGDPDRKSSGGMLGANRLAIEAFSFFTSLPENKALHTVGFTGQRSRNTRWTWPLWNVPISVSCIQSVLTFAELQAEQLSTIERERLRDRGIVAAYRTYRILVGKTPNFTPPQRIA